MSPATEVSAALFDQDTAVPPAWIADGDAVRWHQPGLMSAWLDGEGRWAVERRLGTPMEGDLLTWWMAPADHEREGAALDTLAGQARRLLDPRLLSLLRIRLWPLLDLGRERSPRLVDWVARHVLVVPVPLVGSDLAALNLAVQPPCPALFRVVGAATPVQQRLLDVRQEAQEKTAAQRAVLRARLDAGRALAAARRAAMSTAEGRLPDMLPARVSAPTPADTGERT